MSYQGPMLIKEPELRWPIIMVAAVITLVIALLLGVLQHLLMSQPAVSSYPIPRHTLPLRAGESEFEQVKRGIVVNQLVGREKIHPFNNLVVELNATVTNSTGRAISGLEMRGAILDRENSIVRERTIVIVPFQQTLVEVNEAITVRVLLEAIDKDTDRAQTVLEATGIQFEN